MVPDGSDPWCLVDLFQVPKVFVPWYPALTVMVTGGSVQGTRRICSMVTGRSVPRYHDDPDHLDTDPL